MGQARKRAGAFFWLSSAVVAATLLAPGCGGGEAPSEEASGATEQGVSAVDGSVDGTAGPDAFADAAEDGDASPACRSVTLDAEVDYGPRKAWRDGTATLAPPFSFDVPSSLPVIVGNAGNKRATLMIVRADADPIHCTYVGGSAKAHPTTATEVAKGLAYALEECDCDEGTVTATKLTLHVQNGDEKDAADRTEVRLTLEEHGCQAGDGGRDGASDAGADATDATSDASRDSATDAAADAPLEAAADAAPEASPDAAACVPANCDDGNACTTDTCNAGVCTHVAVADGTSCSDGNACTQRDACRAGVCAGSPVTCAATDACHSAGTCDPATGACSNPTAPNGTRCNDNNTCTSGDSCSNGVCGGVAYACTATECQATSTCDGAGGCTTTPKADGAACSSDNIACTNDVCTAGTCTHSLAVGSCLIGGACVAEGAANPSNPCQTCQPAVSTSAWSNSPDGATCSDGNACTTGDVCQAGACTGKSVTCGALDACHVAGVCDPSSGACTNPVAPVGTICGSSTNLCNGVMACSAVGVCVQGPPVPFDTSNPCSVGTCNPATGAVTYSPAPAGTACGDNSNKCVGSFACNGASTCVQGPAPVIDDGNACTSDSCDPATGVTHTPIAGCVPLPPDPSTIAPPIDPSVPTDIYGANSYLFGGANAIQTGVAPGVITPQRIVVLRGSAVSRDGNPVTGATVTILGHPEYGQTLTRADGAFTMGVNGGGTLVVQLTKQGLITAQRSFESEWRAHVNVPQLIMVAYDSQVTSVSLGANSGMQVARGNAVTDVDGTRTSTVMIPSGTRAVLQMPDGSTQAVLSAHLRATEVTVGPSGPKAMPASLPPQSGYTYAVSLDLDEAVAAHATVQFNVALPVYVDNFLGFPVGGIVPSGYYDPKSGLWIASADGRVVRIVDTTGGVATVDTDGDGVADDDTALAALGITAEERATLAKTYGNGSSLWRVPVTHFSLWDFNWGAGPEQPAAPPGGNPPEGPDAGPDGSSADAGSPDSGDDASDASDADATVPKDPCEDELRGSIIGCDRLTLGEELPVAGTSLALRYASDRVNGYARDRTIKIAVTDHVMSPTVKRVEVEVAVAGRTFALGPFQPVPDQVATFVWDGKDAEGRSLRGVQTATITIGYVYPLVPLTPSERPDVGYDRTFGHFSYYGTPVTANASSHEVTLWSTRFSPVGTANFDRIGAEGWSVTQHHVYDPSNGVLYRGDGSWRAASNVLTAIEQPASSYGSVLLPDIQSSVSIDDLAVAPDGTFYYAWTDAAGFHIDGVAVDGTMSRFYNDATASGIDGHSNPIKVGPDGSVYVAYWYQHRVDRVSPSGQVTRVAGNGSQWTGTPEGGTAADVPLGYVGNIALDHEGNVYIYDVLIGSTNVARISQVTPGGALTTLMSYAYGYNSALANPLDGVPAAQAYLTTNVLSLAATADGSLYIVEAPGRLPPRIRRIRADGFVELVAAASGLSATPAPGQIAQPQVLAPSPSGGVYVCDDFSRVLELLPGGRIRTLLGNDTPAKDSTGAPMLDIVCGMALANAPNGDLFTHVASWGGAMPYGTGIMRIGSSLPRFALGQLVVPENDGQTYHVFSGTGKHLSTVDAVTGLALSRFAYDGVGRLQSLTSLNGDTVTIQGDANGPTAIVGPFGHTTKLAVQNGLLVGVVDPSGAQTSMTYGPGSVLATLTDANGGLHAFTYGADGLLATDKSPSGLVQSASMVETRASRATTITTTLGRTASFRSDSIDDTHVRRMKTAPSGTSVSTIASDSSATTTYPDGTTVTQTLAPDPLFGDASRFPGTTVIRLPSGLTKTITEARTVSTAPNNALGITSARTSLTANSSTYSSYYDASSATVRLTTPTNFSVLAMLDPSARPIGIYAPGSGIAGVQITRDTRGRVSALAVGSRVTTFQYDTRGALSVVTDPLNRAWSFAADPNGRLVQWTTPDGAVARFAYDGDGHTAAISPPGRSAHSFAYGAGDLLAAYTPPSVAAGDSIGATLYSYDGDGQLARLLRPDSVALVTGFDSAGRVVSLTAGSDALTFGYDALSGALTSLTTSNAEIVSLKHDGFLLTDTTWTGPVNGGVHWTYDDMFHVASEQVRGTAIVSYSRDLDGRVTAAGDESISYDSQTGKLSTSRLGSVSDSYAYSSYMELESYTAQFQANPLIVMSFVQDDGGRISSKTETIGGQSHKTEYGYDPRSRLVQVTLDGMMVESYQYDENGNRTQATAGGLSFTGTYDVQDKLLTWGGISCAYDANGDLVSKSDASGVASYTYDGFGTMRHATLPNGSVIDYEIDGLGRRVAKSVNGSRTAAWVYSTNLSPIAQQDATGVTVSRFVYGRSSRVPDYMVRGGVTYRVITDQLGSVRLIVDVSTGIVVQRIDYDTWGNVTSDSNPAFQPFGFAGGLYDPDTKLVQFGQREYDPVLGRWTRRDPLGMSGSRLNLYAYASDAPNMRVDPNGLADIGYIHLNDGSVVQSPALERKINDYFSHARGKDTQARVDDAWQAVENDRAQWQKDGKGYDRCLAAASHYFEMRWLAGVFSLGGMFYDSAGIDFYDALKDELFEEGAQDLLNWGHGPVSPTTDFGNAWAHQGSQDGLRDYYNSLGSGAPPFSSGY